MLQNDTANNLAINVLKGNQRVSEGHQDEPLSHVCYGVVHSDQCTELVRVKHYTRDGIMFDQDNDFDTKNAKAASLRAV